MKRTIVIECETCNGTGLHRECGGAAVVCGSCKGTGKTEFTYNEFEGRKEMEGITRVFPNCAGDKNYYYFHIDKDYVIGEGEVLHFSKYGCSYSEWKDGVEPTPMEEMYCPAEYILEDKTDVENAPCSFCKDGASSDGCKFYWEMSKCWDEWHKRNV